MAIREQEYRSPYRPRKAQRTGRLGRLVLFVTGLVAVAAVGPIVWGIIAGVDGPNGATSAFASAPPGTYAVVARQEGAVDVVSVVRADQPSSPLEIARVAHLDGFTTTGAVDPRGRYVALLAVDSGTPLEPAATLVLIDLEDGGLHRLVTGVDAGWRPLWNQNGTAVVVTRTRPGESGSLVDVFEVGIDGALTQRWTQEALGVYPVGWKDGRLLTVAIDGRGSTLQAEGQDLLHLSDGFTRDWAVAPDGSAIAFVEVVPGDGLRYLPRVASLTGDARVAAQALLGSAGEALGAAWKPGGAPVFGDVPRVQAGGGDVSAQNLRVDGFDVPLAYSPDGTTLAVVHWDGRGFDDPGRPALQLVRDGQRLEVPGHREFFGWARR
jgi:hypothetical protein